MMESLHVYKTENQTVGQLLVSPDAHSTFISLCSELSPEFQPCSQQGSLFKVLEASAMTPKHTLLRKAPVCFCHCCFLCLCVGPPGPNTGLSSPFLYTRVVFLLCDHGTSMKTVLHINEVFFSCNHVLESKRT